MPTEMPFGRAPIWKCAAFLVLSLPVNGFIGFAVTVAGITGPGMRVLSAISEMLFLLLIPLATIPRRFERTTRQLLGYGPLCLKHLAPVLALAVCAMLVASETSLYLREGLRQSETQKHFWRSLTIVHGPAGWAGALFCLALVPAACEEFFFRGFLLRALLRRIAFSEAAVVSAALFALVHFDVLEAPGLLLFGLVLAIVARWTGSVWWALIVHALNNSCALVGGNLIHADALRLPNYLVWVLASIGGIASVFWLLSLTRTRVKEVQEPTGRWYMMPSRVVPAAIGLLCVAALLWRGAVAAIELGLFERKVMPLENGEVYHDPSQILGATHRTPFCCQVLDVSLKTGKSFGSQCDGCWWLDYDEYADDLVEQAGQVRQNARDSFLRATPSQVSTGHDVFVGEWGNVSIVKTADGLRARIRGWKSPARCVPSGPGLVAISVDKDACRRALMYRVGDTLCVQGMDVCRRVYKDENGFVVRRLVYLGRDKANELDWWGAKDGGGRVIAQSDHDLSRCEWAAVLDKVPPTGRPTGAGRVADERSAPVDSAPKVAKKPPTGRPGSVAAGPSGDDGPAKAAGVSRFIDTVIEGGTGDRDDLPFPVRRERLALDADAELEGRFLKSGMFAGDKATLAAQGDKLKEAVAKLKVPEGKRIFQLQTKPRKATSVLGQAMNFAGSVTNQYKVVDENGNTYALAGYYAIVKREGQEFIEFFFTPDPTGSGYNGLLNFKTDGIRRALRDQDDAVLGLIFVVPCGKSIVVITSQSGRIEFGKPIRVGD
jgi:membrane protease YdiL (CAAX protease family)